ncbi:MAG: 3-phosphoserine/phosphohydroxythreonine transaminase [Acidobacteriota bacterium]|nr:3-phosphoserine/phosphohydroxythreonine transaminase [Acidobacteriota bacterium]
MSEARRLLSFGAGPALWPDPVLEEASGGLLPGAGGGLSVLEWSHRGGAYGQLHERALERLRRLLGVGPSHEVLLLPGGATLQFAMVPANLRPPGRSADYLVTGHWARRAARYAALTGAVNVVASSESEGFARIPPPGQWALDPRAAYFHITTNNTIAGTQLHVLPSPGKVPLVADASSDILLRELPVTNFDLLYAGAQKNLGPAGLAVVVIRRALLEAAEGMPEGVLGYRDHAQSGSRLNTPPTALVFLLEKMLAWIEAEGGRSEMIRRARERAALIYGALDRHPEVYQPSARHEDRSVVNVVFRLRSKDREEAFIEAAAREGMVGLAGHRTVGGLRASLYAAMPVDGARRLAALIDAFADRERR